MANICSFLMKAKGNKEDVEQFYNAMIQKGNTWMGRGADASINWEDVGVAIIDGWCKWSIISALIDNVISMRENSDRWSFGEGINREELEFITLYEACERWNIVMEVYSEEGGIGFQEHFICDKGTVLCEDCVDWEEYDIYDFETKEEAEEELNTKFTDEEWANEDDGRICRGGFGEWIFKI